MMRVALLGVTLAFALGAIRSGGTASAAPLQSVPPAVRYFGSVQINGANAPAGTLVTASAGATYCGPSGGDGNGVYNGTQYVLDIPADAVGCGPGATVSFAVNGQTAVQVAQIPFTANAIVVNLTVLTGQTPQRPSGGPPVPPRPPAAPAYPPPPPTMVTLTLGTGWQLVSGSQGAQISGAVGRLYTYRAGYADYRSFSLDTELQGCFAYWAYFPNGGTVRMRADEAQECTLTLRDGEWAMVGNTSGTDPAAVVGAQQSWAYVAGAYVSTTNVPPGAGVWVEGPGTISVGPPGTIPPAPPSSPSPPAPPNRPYPHY